MIINILNKNCKSNEYSANIEFNLVASVLLWIAFTKTVL